MRTTTVMADNRSHHVMEEKNMSEFRVTGYNEEKEVKSIKK
jgi:hypothetical protein